MKRTILAFALAATALCASAQDVFDAGDNKPYFGARLSLDITVPTDISFKNSAQKIDLLNAGAGFSFGGIYNLPICKNLYFEPGVNFYYHTAKLNGKIFQSADPDDLFGEEEGSLTPRSGSIREFGMQIPMVFGYHFDFDPIRISFFTGPVLNIGLSGKAHITMKEDGYNYSDSMYDSFNRASLDWRFGVGATYDHHYTIAISGDAGMTNWMKKISGLDNKMHRNNVSITLGYNF